MPAEQGGGVSSAPRFSITRNTEAEQARREYDEVVRQYTNMDGSKRRGWMKAPNGKDTNLTERQWVQVRTQVFKKWFGDWEGQIVADHILADKDISSDGALLKMETKAQRAEAKRIYDTFKDEPVETADGRTVRFTSIGFKEIKSHSADPHTLAIVPILRDVIASAHYIGLGDSTVENGNVLKYYLYARRVNLGDGSMVARIVLREDVNGDVFYDGESTSLEKNKGDYKPRTPQTNCGARARITLCAS